MSQTRSTTRCARSRRGQQPCGRPFSEHDPVTLACPDGSGHVFRKDKLQPTRASVSFSKVEIDALDFMLKGLRTGKDLRIAVRAAQVELTGVERKLGAMRRSMQLRARDERADQPQQEREEDTGS